MNRTARIVTALAAAACLCACEDGRFEALVTGQPTPAQLAYEAAHPVPAAVVDAVPTVVVAAPVVVPVAEPALAPPLTVAVVEPPAAPPEPEVCVVYFRHPCD